MLDAGHDPLVRRAVALLPAPPRVALFGASPDHVALVERVEQDRADTRRCPGVMAAWARPRGADPVGVQRPRDGPQPHALCRHAENAPDRGGLVLADLPDDMRALAISDQDGDVPVAEHEAAGDIAALGLEL